MLTVRIKKPISRTPIGSEIKSDRWLQDALASFQNTGIFFVAVSACQNPLPIKYM